MNIKTCFICQECGSVHPKWVGKCQDCGAWNSVTEEYVENVPKETSLIIKEEFINLSAQFLKVERINSKITEFDRVLGGGLVKGSAILIGGDPGIGKSTLLLQIVSYLSNDKIICAYISGEESTDQIQLRARRLGLENSPVELLSATNIETILIHEKMHPI